MYDAGVSTLHTSCRFPLRPTIGNGGLNDLSNPVAQTTASTASTSPPTSSIPPGTNLRIPPLTTSTLGSRIASRYPGAGVSLRQPMGNSGISALHSAGSPPSAAAMNSEHLAAAHFCCGDPSARESANLRFESRSSVRVKSA